MSHSHHHHGHSHHSHRELKRGDHIYVDYGPFFHHGIYYDFDQVIHYYKGEIRKDSLRRFRHGKRISVKRYRRCSHRKKVISRAKRDLGEKRYHFFLNNCEHFAYWCKTGRKRCKQLEQPHKAARKFVAYHGYKKTKHFTHKVKRVIRRVRCW